MKKAISLFLAVAFFCTCTMQVTAQQTTLPEVTVSANTYKYLRSVGGKDESQRVKLLQQKAASFDVKNSEYYEDDYDNYFISFYLPDGYILAVYNSAGKLIRTAERYKNVAVPANIRDAVGQRFPNWAITKDVYVVTYKDEPAARKLYKLTLENGNKHLRVRVNEKGDFVK